MMKKSVLMAGVVLASASGFVAAADSLFVDSTGNTGIGTSTPATKLHVSEGDLTVEQPNDHAQIIFKSGTNTWAIVQNQNTGRLVFDSDGVAGAPFKFGFDAVDNLFRVGVLNSKTVDINGDLVVKGVPVADYVFAPDYKLKTIEEQTEFMWKNKHLPSVQGGGANMKADINVMSNQMAILEELEKAHIYISQLNETIKEMKSEIESLKK